MAIINPKSWHYSLYLHFIPIYFIENNILTYFCMVTWPTMHTINFILLHAYFIFCTNYLLENRIELCIVIHDRCMYRKNGMKFEFPNKIYQLYHFLDETWQINYCKNGICLFLLFFIITIVGSILQGYLFKERWTTVRPHLYKCYNL